MADMRQRGTVVSISGVIPSLVLSLLASAAATYLLRRFLSTETGAGGANQEAGQGRPPAGNVSVAVPVIVLTFTNVSGNRLGVGRRGMPPPFFLPFLLARVLRKKQQHLGWQRRKH
jgi:hypothetical protein